MVLLLSGVFLPGCGASLTDSASGVAGSQQLAPQAAGAGASASITPSAATGTTPAPAATAAVATSGAAAQPVSLSDEGPIHVADAAAFTAAATPGNTAYKIGPQDVLDIAVFKVPDLSRSVQVSDAGTVNLPLVGEVPAGGKTARELEQDLTQKLGAKYLQSPQVNVYIKEYNSRRVTVDGAVTKPGVYPINGKTSLVQLIASAGGTTEASDNSDVVVFRQISGKKSAARFSLTDIRAGEAKDPELQEGDVVVVNTSALKAAFQNVLKALPVTSMFVPLI